MATTLASDADMLERIEVFCRDTGMPLSTFGRMAIGDGSLVANLRSGRSLTLKSAQRLLDFMTTYAPDAQPAEAA
jgi:hypothetical protein